MEKKKGKQGITERDEAERIYRAIFKAPIPSEIRERYHQAIHILFPGPMQKEDQVLAELLRTVSDLEALELAARRRNKMHPLVFRFRLMVHLAENIPANQRIFVNSSGRRIHSYISLVLGSIRTLYKFLKGSFLLRRTGDV